MTSDEYWERRAKYERAAGLPPGGLDDYPGELWAGEREYLLSVVDKPVLVRERRSFAAIAIVLAAWGVIALYDLRGPIVFAIGLPAVFAAWKLAGMTRFITKTAEPRKLGVTVLAAIVSAAAARYLGLF